MPCIDGACGREGFGTGLKSTFVGPVGLGLSDGGFTSSAHMTIGKQAERAIDTRISFNALFMIDLGFYGTKLARIIQCIQIIPQEIILHCVWQAHEYQRHVMMEKTKYSSSF